MSDREEIVQLINLYGLAMDTRRWDLFDCIFTPDCDADYGATSHWTNLDRFKADFGAFHAVFDATQHMMTNHLVTVDGDVACAHTYGSWRLIRHAAGDPPLWDGTGWYDDQLVRTAAGWRITRRVCRVVWFTGNTRVQQPLPEIAFRLDLTSLHKESELDQLGYLKAIAKTAA